MNWFFAAGQTLLVIIAFVGFSLVPLLIARVRSMRILACAPLFSTAILGVLSLASPLIPWTPLAVFLEFVVLCLIAFGMRPLFAQRGAHRPQPDSMFGEFMQKIRTYRFDMLWALAGVVVTFALMAFALSGMSLASPIGTENYDNPFHYSVVRYILDSGIASPIGAGSVMGDATAVYPDIWHCVTALVSATFGISIPIAGWETCLMLMGFVIPLGFVVMTRCLFPTCSPITPFIVAIGYGITNYTVVGFVGFGSLFANLFGVALLPSAIALSGMAVDRREDFGGFFKVAIVVVCVIGLGLAHPSTVFVYGIMVVPLWVAQARKWYTKGLIVAGAFALWAILYNSSFFRRTVNCLDRTGTDIETGMKYAQKFGLDYSFLTEHFWIVLCVALLILALFIAVAIVLNKRWSTSWYLVGVGFMCVLALLALFPLDAVSQFFVGFWYRDEVRLRAFVLYLAIPLVCVLGVVIIQAIAQRVPGHFASAIGCCLLALFIVGVLFLDARTALKLHREYSYASSPAATLTDVEKQFLEEVSEITAGEVVLNNFNDNSVWLYPIYGTDALIKGRPANQMSSMDEGLCTLIAGIDTIASDEDVHAVAEEIGLQWVVKMSDAPNGITPFNSIGQIDYQPCDAVLKLSPETEGFELALELEGMQLYKVIL